MCEIVVINRGEIEIETPNQFKKHFGFFPKTHKAYKNIQLVDMCLCQCDLDETFEEKNIEYVRSHGDYYVGDLDNLEEIDFHFKPS